MIRAKIRERGEERSLTMTGHADYDPGHDIVCAGASAVGLALLGYLYNAGEHLTALSDVRAVSGDLSIHCRGDEMVGEAFKMAAIGLLQIAEEYPDHVRVELDAEGY